MIAAPARGSTWRARLTSAPQQAGSDRTARAAAHRRSGGRISRANTTGPSSGSSGSSITSTASDAPGSSTMAGPSNQSPGASQYTCGPAARKVWARRSSWSSGMRPDSSIRRTSRDVALRQRRSVSKSTAVAAAPSGSSAWTLWNRHHGSKGSALLPPPSPKQSKRRYSSPASSALWSATKSSSGDRSWSRSTCGTWPVCTTHRGTSRTEPARRRAAYRDDWRERIAARAKAGTISPSSPRSSISASK